MPLPYHDDERAVLAEIERENQPPLMGRCPYCHKLMWYEYDEEYEPVGVFAYCDECGHTEELTG